jgi:hypothetical protein
MEGLHANKPHDGLNVEGEIRFQNVASFWNWANGNEVHFPIRIVNIGVIPSYPQEYEIDGRKALLDNEANIRWLSQSLKDTSGYIAVSQAQ